MRSAEDAVDFALAGVAGGQALIGTASRRLVDALIPLLAHATARPDECYFAVWEGFGDLGDSLRSCPPTLDLPHRSYHLFLGQLGEARTSFSYLSWLDRSANLWWPADRAWCVSTEVDAAWTYVGGTRELIDGILACPELDAIATAAGAEW